MTLLAIQAQLRSSTSGEHVQMSLFQSCRIAYPRCDRHVTPTLGSRDVMTIPVEVLRYVDHAHQSVPRSERLCRFCKKDIETPEHALISCESLDALVELRASFLAKLFTELPVLRNRMAELSNTEFLKAIIYPRSTIALVAQYAYEVLELFYAEPVFRLDAD